MKFAIFIQCSPFEHQGSLSAYHFSLAALSSGHDIQQVFFYQSGVLHGLTNTTLPSDEINIIEHWQQLASQYNIPLRLCITQAETYGITAPPPAFKLSGLAEFFAESSQADRLISFKASQS
ncbi:Putative sulfurtransferase DsrE [Piscirickettsia salmonis]|uniref:sulfurtransferase complex subunit TusD n=1 Tax=Piscirickettsia salmonis TaxID=1238 RepID=UPI0012BAA159|nr:sulfurtransferase complex subunit TusD [Piscirickettsia salmonis]QGP55785.1 Putative sulfurtransferase DsrE [Piscirickettsia salmonis]QGP58346.1 Putative sulfurtransferase DsrE [Piscirickettsia salmonis]QGP65355.1 Putative sulfurtransferase DsrE [Piscirickettsia salmonis]